SRITRTTHSSLNLGTLALRRLALRRDVRALPRAGILVAAHAVLVKRRRTRVAAALTLRRQLPILFLAVIADELRVIARCQQVFLGPDLAPRAAGSVRSARAAAAVRAEVVRGGCAQRVDPALRRLAASFIPGDQPAVIADCPNLLGPRHQVRDRLF